MESKFDAVIKYMDLLFPYFPDYEWFGVSSIVDLIPNLGKTDKFEIRKLHVEITMELESFGYADGESANSVLIRLTNNGRKVKRAGGHTKYLNAETENSSPGYPKLDKTRTDQSSIFIVHGHNTEVKQSVARVIEKLGLKPIILHEQANSGMTVIEKFEKHSNVGFAIILLTDDDEGKSKREADLGNRARQNVILEMGYFIGKLSRSRVLPLYSEGVELPSDIHGLLYVPLDKAENWKFSIVKELNAVGYTVDANLLL